MAQQREQNEMETDGSDYDNESVLSRGIQDGVVLNDEASNNFDSFEDVIKHMVDISKLSKDRTLVGQRDVAALIMSSVDRAKLKSAVKMLQEKKNQNLLSKPSKKKATTKALMKDDPETVYMEMLATARFNANLPVVHYSQLDIQTNINWDTAEQAIQSIRLLEQNLTKCEVLALYIWYSIGKHCEHLKKSWMEALKNTSTLVDTADPWHTRECPFTIF